MALPPAHSTPLRAWAGLAFGAAAWFLQHQAASNLNYADCEAGDGVLVIGSGLLALVATAAGGWLSWGAWRAAGGRLRETQEPSGRFIAALSLMAAALFALTIVFQTVAGALVPGCWR